MREIVERFVAGLPERLQAIKAAADAQDLPLLQRLAHQLKGAAGGYGFPSVTDAAAEVERCIVDHAEPARNRAALGELLALCARARAS